METLWKDLRHGFRMLVRTPAVTAVAVLALALGIGANTAIFSVVYAVLLRPLPVRDPAGVVVIQSFNPRLNIPPISPGFSAYLAWKREASCFDDMAAAWSGASETTIARAPEKIQYWRVTSTFFSTLGVQPAIGRPFRANEDRPGDPRIAILGHDLWGRMFQGDAGAVGQTIRVDGELFTIVGVMPPGFQIDGKPADVYAPMAQDPKRYLPVTVYARLKPGVTPARAQSEMDAVAKRLDTRASDWRARVWTLRDSTAHDVRQSLLVLLGAVALVLLIACANIASLLLARSNARRRETAIRAALGAGKRRLVRQFLTESVLLSSAGGGAGLLLAAWAMRLVPLLDHERLPNSLLKTRIDGAVLAFTLAAALATGVLCGLAPALSTVFGRLHEALQEGGRTGESRRRKRLWNGLVISETALALVLMIGATLLVRSFLYLVNTAPGFRVEGLVLAQVNLNRERYPKPEQRIAFYEEALRKVRAIPGVASATLATSLPLDGDFRAMSLPLEGHPYSHPREWPVLWHRTVEQDYFRTLEIPLRRGRLFREDDRIGAPHVAVVNESMARRFWPGQNAVGKHMGQPDSFYFEIVGVVADVRHQDVTKEGLVEVYFPYLQGPDPGMNVVARADARTAPVIARAVASVDATMPLPKTRELMQLAVDRLVTKRLTMSVIAAFAALALVLAAIGIYGVLSFTVAQRTHEIGVRMALGAPCAAVLRMIVGQAAGVAAIGIALGLAGALAVSRVLETMVFGVRPTDPWIYAGVSAALLGVAVMAAWLPARRAARVDPVAALRQG